jgi:hypothetical protein
MAAIEVNVSLPLLQPSIRHRGNYPRPDVRSVLPSRASPSLEGLNAWYRAKH